MVIVGDANNRLESETVALKKETILYHPDFSQPLYLATDASQVGCGGFLYQLNI